MIGNRLLVGLTGGIGTGKSTALAVFKRMGAGTVCADERVHEMSRRGGALHKAIVTTFGSRYLDGRGEIDRKALAAAVFAKPALRRRLERATHPPLLRKMRRLMADSKRSVVVADMPLLFEVGLQKDFDVTVLVSAPYWKAVFRVMRRDGSSRSQALSRMRAQMPSARKERLADIVIHNLGTRRELEDSVSKLYRAFELIAKGSASRS